MLSDQDCGMSGALPFALGLVGLIVGANFVVDAASRIGARFGLTPMVVGLTIVAIGTSAPEMAVVLQAVDAGDTELAVGAVIGSNIANVLLVLGLAVCLGTVHVANRVVRIDIPIMIAASGALILLSLDGRLSRVDGALLFVGMIVFVGWTLQAAPRVPVEGADGSSGSLSQSASSLPTERPLPILLGALVIGIGLLALASRYVVSGAEQIAASLGVPELIVGLTIVALGTSAPEIVTTVMAALKGRRELAVGNAVGSNIFNILFVLGGSSLVSRRGIDIGTDAIELDLPILLAAAVACLPLVFWDNKLDRWEGVVFVGYYLAYLMFLILDATGHRASDPFAFVLLVFVMPLTILTVGVVIVHQRRLAARANQDVLIQ
ncbi:MAG: cation:H+ antiporter [Acidimicrobiales bacterium]